MDCEWLSWLGPQSARPPPCRGDWGVLLVKLDDCNTFLTMPVMQHAFGPIASFVNFW